MLNLELLSSNGFFRRYSFHKSNLKLEFNNRKARSSEYFATLFALYEAFGFHHRCPHDLNNEGGIFLYETPIILFIKCQFFQQLSHTECCMLSFG